MRTCGMMWGGHPSQSHRSMIQPSLENRAQAATLLRAQPREFPPFADIFGNGRPVEVEIGCGKGKFLIARAVENPDINFIGVDIVWKWMKYAVERSTKRGMENIRFIKADARELLRHGFRDESVSIFHIYFPDPWPKKRHRKRRLVTGELLRLMERKLETNGLIELATDHEDYFMQMRASVVRSGVEWKLVTEKSNERLFAAISKTNYEIKYAAAGRTLNYLELRK
jgi:tRNA (guanine-N7-)-methyltransferase